MCVKLFLAARRLQVGGLLLLVLFIFSCANSPTDQLDRAESLLARLENSGADAYLKYELASARRKVEEARKFIRKNRFELASQYLSSVCQTLDSCSIAFSQLRQLAKQQCQQQMAILATEIDSLRSLMANLPRQSYIDQNRYDIYTHRLRRYREELAILQKLIDQQDFPTALQRSMRLDFQLRQSLAGLIGSTPIPSRVAKRTPAEKEPAPKVAASSHSGTR
ncbi:MAG: DUF4398 domain-containing protein [candidate division KSB1 bacterium]|nr:DUF4398 domain-containing protein [candidate division KSB1 bacterium]MDZ7303394.1 DUF4398 domain-containing protein [candidate division KSB1 bacterium]MDZ7312288.1 DUF4398 domain-containing protein [candidate division KSB1 bacterium]